MSVDSTVSNIPNQPDPNLVNANTAQQFQQAASQATPAAQGSAPQSQANQAGGSGPTGLPAASAPQTPAQPNQAQPGQANQPNQQNQPPRKPSAFTKVLEMATGGPISYQERVKDADGNYTGATKNVTQHRSAGTLAAVILAHATEAFLAGGGAKTYGEAGQAGAAAYQRQKQENQQKGQQLQQRDDQAYANQINTTDHNLKTHALMLDLNKQQTDQMQSTVDGAQPIINSLEVAQKDNKDPLILKQNVTEDELTKMLSSGTAHVTRQSAVPDGVSDVYDASGKQVMNPDGTPKKTYTYTVYNPAAMVTLTDDIRKTNPELATAAAGQAMPVRVLANLWLKRGQTQAAQGYVDDFQKRLNAMLPKDEQQKNPISFTDAVKKDPILNGIKPILGRYAGMDPDQALDQMRKDKVNPDVIGSFQRLFNMNEKDLSEARATKERADRKAQDEQAQKVASDIALEREKKLAVFKKQLGVTQDDGETVSNTKSYPNEWVNPKTGIHYNLSSPTYNMVEGNEDPSQMAKRATKGSTEYNNLLKQANDYSFARYNKPFDMAQAQTDYKYANQKSTQDTIKLLRSLTGDDNKNAGGTFGNLEQAFNNLGNTQIPKVNDVFNWLSQNSGQPGVPAFEATLVPVSDELGKILGGGVATDSSRKEAKDTINKAFSQQQGKAALTALRSALANRQNSLVGDNRYLTKQFGKMSQPSGQSQQGQSQYTKYSSDGKWGWDGKNWQSIGQKQ